jgi:two-component system, NtrC family, sensor kinase
LRRRGPTKRPAKARRTKKPAATEASAARASVDLVERLRRERDEAVELQAASVEVLKIISASPSNLKSVFEAMLANALRICEAKFGHVLHYDGGRFHATYLHDVPQAYRTFWEQHGPISPSPNTGLGWLARTKQVAHIPDLKADPAYAERQPLRVVTVEQAGARTFLAVPMLKENELVGAIVIYRLEVRPFAEKQIDLVRNFADQAVIAIENARLFNETREALEQQTATTHVLQVINASPGNLGPVFDAILENAMRLCEAIFGHSWRFEGEVAYPMASRGEPRFTEWLARQGPVRVMPGMASYRLMQGERIVQFVDPTQTPEYETHPEFRAFIDAGGIRTTLAVALRKDDEVLGAIVVYRQEVRPFNDRQVALLDNFAAQAVIAMENARLLNELRQRTDDLTRSLEDLRTAQDRLIQTEKLASLGQLTAGIAHEIKNPLNFVNNFSALSTELIDEMMGVLSDVSVDGSRRDELDAITQTLKSNLDKVIQHGKRADSIVKNMLLHSRQGSGEQRPADINALVDESLNLAYHGARAENPQFNVALGRDFDPNAGMVEVFPQEITRVLLNLIANGFYAVTRRKAADGDNGFEPALSTATRSHDDRVEIRIRDNGTGIPPDVQGKIFDPFFTTKPAGEGTGLGLSMSHDIIVKQHGGRIDVETEPGVFTEMIVTLQRRGLAQKASEETR